MIYLIESAKGYWLPMGRGYTSDQSKAGRFTFEEMKDHNLDRCTLLRDREAERRLYGTRDLPHST